MTTFADVGATLAQAFWGDQIGTFGFIGAGQGPATGVWTATLMAVGMQENGPPVFTPLDDLTYASVACTDELVGTGSAEVVAALANLSDATKRRLQDVWRAPVELWIYRDGVQEFAGKVVSVVPRDGVVSITARGLLIYLSAMAVDDDDKSFSDYDQTLIVKELVDWYQAQTFGNFGLDTTALTATGVLRDLQVSPFTASTFDRVFDEMAGRANGFDLYVDPATRRLFTRYPRRGSDLSRSVIIDVRQATGASWSMSCAPGQVATDSIAVASSSGGGGVVGRYGDSVLRSLAGRWTFPSTHFGVTQQDTIDGHAAQNIADRGTQAVAVSTQLAMVNGDITYGQAGPGDLVTIDLDVGLGPMQIVRRLSRMAIAVSDAGEQLAVDFV